MINPKNNFILCVFILYSSAFFSQISEGGIPYSFKNNIEPVISEFNIDQPSLAEIQSEINNNEDDYLVGIIKDVQLSLTKNGTWIFHSDGSKSCFLKIRSKSAIGISLFFENFIIPKGAELFVYNENKKHIIGKFSSITNLNNSLTHTQIVEGEVSIIEYYQPQNSSGNLDITLNKIGYMFRGFEDYLKPFKNSSNKPIVLRADPCQIDVACSPENIGWSEPIDAVVLFTYVESPNIYQCSGSVINNTADDCTPYILTAWHCGDNQANQNLSGYTWYWNYQKSSCQPNTNGSNPSKGNQTMINGVVRASSGSGTLNNPPSSNQEAGSDFALVELNSIIPTSYNTFYAGWDRSTNSISSGVSIHHPSGSAKKISTFNSSPTSTSFNGGAANAHWNVSWSSTSNGHGVTEGGSSGASLFNQNKKIIGQLSGGSSFCSSPNSPDQFGKFSTSWSSNGSSPGAKLKPWLDPLNLNVNSLDGTYAPCSGTVLECEIAFWNSQTQIETDTINNGESIDFFGGSNLTTANYNWNFDKTGLGGVSVPNSTDQSPSGVIFNSSGLFQVQLTVTNNQETCLVDTVIKVLPLTTNIEVNDITKKLIYPNPNNGTFNLNISKEIIKNIGTGFIYNSIGEVIQKINFNSLKLSDNLTVNIKGGIPGVYYLKFENNPVFNYKIILID